MTTTDSSVTVGGEPNAVLTIVLPNGEEMSQVADSKGMATFDIPKQTVGSKVTATQATEGAVSDSASITVTQRAVVAPTINRLTTDDTTVTGTGIPGASVKVTLENGMEYTGIVKTDGTYSITIPKQAFNRLVGA
ncbi:autolysin modifier protein, partial [Listeria booriae]|nr:autolysin modifier protein [Listeria booriae]